MGSKESIILQLFYKIDIIFVSLRWAEIPHTVRCREVAGRERGGAAPHPVEPFGAARGEIPSPVPIPGPYTACRTTPGGGVRRRVGRRNGHRMPGDSCIRGRSLRMGAKEKITTYIPMNIQGSIACFPTSRRSAGEYNLTLVRTSAATADPTISSTRALPASTSGSTAVNARRSFASGKPDAALYRKFHFPIFHIGIHHPVIRTQVQHRTSAWAQVLGIPSILHIVRWQPTFQRNRRGELDCARISKKERENKILRTTAPIPFP